MTSLNERFRQGERYAATVEVLRSHALDREGLVRCCVQIGTTFVVLNWSRDTLPDECAERGTVFSCTMIRTATGWSLSGEQKLEAA